MVASCEPPFEARYKELFSKSSRFNRGHEVAECELPLIDLEGLTSSRRACIEEIARASSEWGFFQVLNHGISQELLGEMRREQIKAFEIPFEKKHDSSLWNGSYRWGTPTATSLDQFSWSEAFHVPLARILSDEESCSNGEFKPLRETMKKLAGAMSELARKLAGVLAEKLGYLGKGFTEDCSESTCFLRLNRYPPCPYSPETFGLMPHTDSDFLTVLYQDHVGGLQLMKDSRWVAVKPNPAALIVNIGDLFQAWSNDVYKSVEHKVMVNGAVERYSIAYFLCPSYESIIGSCREAAPLYKSFTFGQFREQVQEDLKRSGYKVGLSRFLI